MKESDETRRRIMKREKTCPKERIGALRRASKRSGKTSTIFSAIRTSKDVIHSLIFSSTHRTTSVQSFTLAGN